MSFSIVYNDSDHEIGWFPFLSGLTLFYSGEIFLVTYFLIDLLDAYEQTIDPLYSVTVPPGDGPLVAFNQVHNTLLGLPYSVCIPQLNHTLKYYSNYTIGRLKCSSVKLNSDHCLHECMVDKLVEECNCVPGYLESGPLNKTQMRLNKISWADKNNFTGELDEIPAYPIFEEGARGDKRNSCTLYQHATCVSRIIKKFNYTSCAYCNGLLFSLELKTYYRLLRFNYPTGIAHSVWKIQVR